MRDKSAKCLEQRLGKIESHNPVGVLGSSLGEIKWGSDKDNRGGSGS